LKYIILLALHTYITIHVYIRSKITVYEIIFLVDTYLRDLLSSHEKVVDTKYVIHYFTYLENISWTRWFNVFIIYNCVQWCKF